MMMETITLQETIMEMTTMMTIMMMMDIMWILEEGLRIPNRLLRAPPHLQVQPLLFPSLWLLWLSSLF